MGLRIGNSNDSRKDEPHEEAVVGVHRRRLARGLPKQLDDLQQTETACDDAAAGRHEQGRHEQGRHEASGRQAEE
jgi:hypothetical protein